MNISSNMNFPVPPHWKNYAASENINDMYSSSGNLEKTHNSNLNISEENSNEHEGNNTTTTTTTTSTSNNNSNGNNTNSNTNTASASINKRINPNNRIRNETDDVEHQQMTSLDPCPNNDKRNPNKTLWIGELDKIKDEVIDENYILYCMFYEYIHDIIKIKLCKEKNSSRSSYAFIEFTNYEIAKQCYNALNGKWIPGKIHKFKLNWAKYNVTNSSGNNSNNSNNNNDNNNNNSNNTNTTLTTTNNNTHINNNNSGSNNNISDVSGCCNADEPITNIEIDEKGTYSLYVGNLNPRTTKEDIENLFTSLYHSVCFVKLIKNTNKNPNKMYCFIHFFNHGECVRALKEMNGYILKGNKIKVSKSNGIKPVNNITSRNVGNLKTNNESGRKGSMGNATTFSPAGNRVYIKNVGNTKTGMNSANLVNSSNVNLKNISRGNLGTDGGVNPIVFNANTLNPRAMNANVLNATVTGTTAMTGTATMTGTTMTGTAMTNTAMTNTAMANTAMTNTAMTNAPMTNTALSSVNMANPNMINAGLINSGNGNVNVNGNNGFPLPNVYYCYDMNKKLRKIENPDYYFYYNNMNPSMNNMYPNTINNSLGNAYKPPFYNLDLTRGANMMQMENYNNDIMYAAPNFANPMAPLHYFAKDISQDNNFPSLNINKNNFLMEASYTMNGNNYNVNGAHPMNNGFDMSTNGNVYCGINNTANSDFNNMNNMNSANPISNMANLTNVTNNTNNNCVGYNGINNVNCENDNMMNGVNDVCAHNVIRENMLNNCDKGEQIETENNIGEAIPYNEECKNITTH